MATAAKIAHDEIRDLIAKGWTPPADVLGRYSHLLKPFYAAKGLSLLPLEKLDRIDTENLTAIIAVFEAFGIELPDPPAVAEAA